MTLMPHISLALAMAALSASPQAATVSTHYSLLGGNTWQVDFNLHQVSGGPAVPGLSVYFDLALFDNLSNPLAPAGWSPIVLQPDAGLAADGVYDALADLGSALQPGQTLGGFSVQFNHLGAGAPGSLRYEFYALDTNGLPVVLSSGNTVTAVPEPSALWLGSLALAVVALRVRAQRQAEVAA